MHNLPILKYPNKILRQKAKKIKDPLDPEIQKLIKDMLESMLLANGVGLAAPQVGKSLQLCVVEFENEEYVLINPKIVSKSKKAVFIEEGCLSFPGKFLKISRPEEIKIRCLNQKGEEVKLKASGVLSRIFQHEIDHLNGILFIDKKGTKIINKK